MIQNCLTRKFEVSLQIIINNQNSHNDNITGLMLSLNLDG